MGEQEDNKLAVKDAKPTFKIKPVGLAARKAALAEKQQRDSVAPAELKVEDATHRIGIVFDDSGSMSGSKITDAHAGTEEFLRCCDPRTTAVSVYPMNEDDHPAVALTTKLYNVAQGIKTIQATGSTPLFATTQKMLQNEAITRGIIFSDGSPNWGDEALGNSVIDTAKEKKVPLDTVFIGNAQNTHAVELMKWIAEQTGGVFIILDPTKSNFRTAFKYLSPGYRAMLADKSFVEKLQEGRVQ